MFVDAFCWFGLYVASPTLLTLQVGRTAVMLAAANGRERVVRCLVHECATRVDVQDKVGAERCETTSAHVLACRVAVRR